MPDVIVTTGTYTAPVTPSATTAQDVLNAAASNLHTGVRVERDKLATALTDTTGASVVNTYQVGGIVAGAKLSVDLEDMHVWSVSGATATVQRGEFGSTAATHASGSIIHVNAEFSPFTIFREINNELRSLSSPSNGLFQVKTVEVSYNPVLFGYDLTATTQILAVLRVQEQMIGPSLNWREVFNWRFELNQDTTVFPSGNALFTPAGFAGRKLLVTYAAPFSPLTALADNVLTVTGLPDSAHDILGIGAAVRCAFPTEIDRNQSGSQASGRRQAEVPAGARLNAARGLAVLRQQRIREEANRLSGDWPTRVPRRQ